MDFENFPYHRKKLPLDQTELAKFELALKEEFLDDLNNNSIYHDYFKGFEENSVQRFKEAYVSHKIHLIRVYEVYISAYHDSKEIRYREKAEEHIDLIKQKKLFNLQLLWRAEKIKVPDIKLAIQFQYWENNIRDCPLIEPVTPEEIELMCEFLRSNDYEASDEWSISYQHYSEMIELDEEGDYYNMPAWFEFYDTRMGTAPYLQLPDIRGDKESRYLILAAEERELKSANDVKPIVQQEIKTLWSNHESLGNFIDLFEDAYIKEISKGFKKFCDKRNNEELDDEQLQDAIDLLKEAEYTVIMDGGLEWREAILKCSQKYINNIIANDIPLIYTEQLLLSELGIGVDKEQLIEESEEDHLYLIYEDPIIRGRILANEPADLNF